MALARGGLPPNWKIGDPVPTPIEGGSSSSYPSTGGSDPAVSGLAQASPSVPGYIAPESAAGGTRQGPQGQSMGAGLYSGAWLKANGFGGVVGDGGDNNQYQLSANGGGWHQVGGSAYGTPSMGPGPGGATPHESPPQTSNVPPVGGGGAAPPAAGAGLGSTGEVRADMNTAAVQGPGGGGIGGGPGLEYIDAPMSMRQGIGQRNLPMLSAALAGLGRTVY